MIGKPAIITIAKSSDDEYTPNSQVEYILDNVLIMLRGVYGELNIIAE